MLVTSAAGDDTLGGLVAPLRTLAPTTATGEAYAVFAQDPALYALPVVDGAQRPIGILNRFKFLEALSRPFGRDLLANRTVAEVMDASPLVVDEGVSLERLSGMLVDDTARYILDGFIVTRGGRYVGVGTGYSLIRRLTERKQAELFHQAHHDPLTGLPNRQLFADRLKQAVIQAARTGNRVAVLYIDVDRFKTVNDSLGHGVGDLLLRGIADRLRAGVRSEDTVARLSGDEFAVVLPRVQAADAAETVARKLLEALREAHRLERHEVNVSGSIGLALFPDDGATAEALLRAADEAAYQAKQFRNTWQRYRRDAERPHTSGLVAFSSVRRALDEGHLHVFYQPQICAVTRAVCAVEALVRWHDPARGPVPAREFVQLAEDAGLISAVTEHVLSVATRDVCIWRTGIAPDLRLAVNVSSQELRDGQLVPMLDRHLGAHRLPPTALEIEITESCVMRVASATTAVLDEVKARGVRLWVDDFGTGYSSLSRLHRLPVDGLKIDKAFIDSIDGDGDRGAIARAIIALGRSLGLVVTAEGVETAEQLALLEASGCDRIQGFLISAPRDAVATERFLIRYRQRVADEA